MIIITPTQFAVFINIFYICRKLRITDLNIRYNSMLFIHFKDNALLLSILDAFDIIKRELFLLKYSSLALSFIQITSYLKKNDQYV